MIYYGSTAIQRSPSQQVILVNTIRNEGGHVGNDEDVTVTTNQKDIIAESKNGACDCSKEMLNKVAKKNSQTINFRDEADIFKEEDKNGSKTGEDFNQMNEINDKNEGITPTIATSTTSTQNQNSLNTTMPVGTTAISKIPILQSNLRQAKCASWAGGELTTQQVHLHLTRNSSQGRQTNTANIVNFNEELPTFLPSTSVNKQNVADKSDGVVFQTPDITDLTPGLS